MRNVYKEDIKYYLIVIAVFLFGLIMWPIYFFITIFGKVKKTILSLFHKGKKEEKEC